MSINTKMKQIDTVKTRSAIVPFKRFWGNKLIYVHITEIIGKSAVYDMVLFMGNKIINLHSQKNANKEDLSFIFTFLFEPDNIKAQEAAKSLIFGFAGLR